MQVLFFWSWLVKAIKSPTSKLETSHTQLHSLSLAHSVFCIFLFFFSIYHIKHAYYGHITSIQSRFPAASSPLTLFSNLSILIATTLFFFIPLGYSFVVRRFIHQEGDWTLQGSPTIYSPLGNSNLFLTFIYSFFAF